MRHRKPAYIARRRSRRIARKMRIDDVFEAATFLQQFGIARQVVRRHVAWMEFAS